MKKYIKTIGALSLLAPLMTTISCVNSQADEENNKIEEEKYFNFDGKDFIPEEDGLYYSSELYNGNLLNDEGEKNENQLVKLDKRDETYATINKRTEFGKGDSILMIYDKDQNDGINIENFKKTIGFIDTSLVQSNKLGIHLKSLGNLSRYDESGWGMKSFITTFNNNGYSNRFFGSTFNETEFTNWNEAMKEQKKYYSPEEWEMLLDSLKMIEIDGELSFSEEKTDTDYWGSEPFLSVATPKNMFSWEKIAKNAIKITYQGSQNQHYQTNDLVFGFIGEKKGDDYKFSSYGTFDIGIKGGKKAKNVKAHIRATKSKIADLT